MRRKSFLLDPDPSDKAGGDNKPADNKPADPPKKKDDAPPTAADTGAGGKTAKEIALEKKVSTLEDDKKSILGRLDAAEKWIKEQVEAKPAPAAKGNFLDEVNSVLGFGLD